MALNALQISQLNNMNVAAQRAQLGTLVGSTEPYGQSYFVDPFAGSDSNAGTSWASAFLTMGKALTSVSTLGSIFFVGDVREEIVASNLKFDVSIIGCGSLHHPDSPGALYNPGAAMWRAPASPTAVTPLLELKGRGWKFYNIAFDCPVDSGAIKLTRNALGTTSEFDASHATFENCRFLSGAYGIIDNGGANNITIKNCEFAGMTTAAIYGSSTAVANPRAWKVFDNMFPANVSGLGNATHMDLSLNESIVSRNFFGTVVSTALYVDLTGGNGNMVTDNFMMGVYQAVDYVAGTGDSWVGNQTIDLSRGTETTATGLSVKVPA